MTDLKSDDLVIVSISCTTTRPPIAAAPTRSLLWPQKCLQSQIVNKVALLGICNVVEGLGPELHMSQKAPEQLCRTIATYKLPCRAQQAERSRLGILRRWSEFQELLHLEESDIPV